MFHTKKWYFVKGVSRVKLHALCYCSVRRGSHENLLDEIHDILEVAKKFNKKHNITGVLYYSEGRFFQYIEGLERVIEDLFDHIAVDPRHHYVHYFGTNLIYERRFSGWSMKYVQKNSRVELFFKNRGEKTLMSLGLNESNLPDFLDELVLAE
nr:BLUF domain-containing protein [Acinetobacter nectaris]